MSISEEKSEENNISNSNINNSEEPKFTQEQRSGIEQSTEIGSNSKIFLIFFLKFLAGTNEYTRNETFINTNNNNSINNSIYPMNQNFNHYLSYLEIPQNNFLEDDNESAQSAPVQMNQESALFDADDYYNYNELLNSYFNRQFGRPLTYDNLKEKINTFLTNEK